MNVNSKNDRTRFVSIRLTCSRSMVMFEYFSFPRSAVPEADKMLYDAKELTLDFRALLSPRGIYRDKGVASSLLSSWHNGRRRRAPVHRGRYNGATACSSTALCIHDLWFLLFREIMVQGYRRASNH